MTNRPTFAQTSFFAGLWAIWKHRNDTIFKGVEANPASMMETMDKWALIAQTTIRNRLEHEDRKVEQVPRHNATIKRLQLVYSKREKP